MTSKVYSGLNQCVIKKGLTTGWTSTCLIFSFVILMYKLYFKKNSLSFLNVLNNILLWILYQKDCRTSLIRNTNITGNLQPLLTWNDLRGPVESVLEPVPHVSKGREPHPAGLDGTTARHPVALAPFLHFFRHVL